MDNRRVTLLFVMFSMLLDYEMLIEHKIINIVVMYINLIPTCV